jgi:hypothetical protein
VFIAALRTEVNRHSGRLKKQRQHAGAAAGARLFLFAVLVKLLEIFVQLVSHEREDW